MERDDFVWVTSTGLRLKMDQIHDQHLQFIERYLLNRGQTPLKTDRWDPDEWRETYDLVHAELIRRGLEPVTEQLTDPRSSQEERKGPTSQQLSALAQLEFARYGRVGPHGLRRLAGPIESRGVADGHP